MFLLIFGYDEYYARARNVVVRANRVRLRTVSGVRVFINDGGNVAVDARRRRLRRTDNRGHDRSSGSPCDDFHGRRSVRCGTTAEDRGVRILKRLLLSLSLLYVDAILLHRRAPAPFPDDYPFIRVKIGLFETRCFTDRSHYSCRPTETSPDPLA